MNSTVNIVIIFIFSSLWISLVLSFTCPYIDKKCQCNAASEACAGLASIPPLHTGSDVANITILFFENGNITNVPRDSLPANLTQIFFLWNPLTTISDDAFEKSASTLNNLQMEAPAFTKLPDSLLKLNNLTTLAITFANIEDWNIPLIHHLAPTLQNLWLFSVGISEWPRWVSILNSLNSLNIEGSAINSIPVDAFSNLSNTLNDISFSLNKLNYLPTALLNLRNLRKLNLSQNQIKNIEAFTSANLTNLTELNLSGNLLADVPPDTFPATLTRLDISNNKLTHISNTTLISCPNLQTLVLSDNPISVIARSAFQNLESLASIAMYSLNLTEIPLALLQLQKLKNVDFSLDTSILCPYPPAPEWTKWYASYNGSLQIDGSCSDGQSIRAYLSGSPPQTTASADSNVGTLVSRHWNLYIWMLFLVLVVLTSL